MEPHERNRHTDRAVHVAVIGAIATVIVGIIPYVVITSGGSDGGQLAPVTMTTEQPVTTTERSPDTTERPPDTTAAPPPTSIPTEGVGIEYEHVELAPGNDSLLDQLANRCFHAEWEARDELYDVAPPGSDYQWYGGTCGGIFEEITVDTCVTLNYLFGLAELCQFGDLLACDELYLESAVDSVFEWYGATCGYRLDFASNGECWVYA